VTMTPEREVWPFLTGGDVLVSEVAARSSDGLASVANEFGAGRKVVGAMEPHALDLSFPDIPAFDVL